MDPLVKLYDPNAPGFFREELAGNFNPLVHTRWEYRPSVQRVAFHQIVAVLGIGAPVDAALHDAGVHCAEDLIAQGAEALAKIPGVKLVEAKKLIAWAKLLMPPQEDAPEDLVDPALAVLIEHAAHEERQAGKTAQEGEGEEAPAPETANTDPGNSAQNPPAQPGDSAPPATPAPATPTPGTAGSTPAA